MLLHIFPEIQLLIIVEQPVAYMHSLRVEGERVGITVGTPEGSNVGSADGVRVGISVGKHEGF
jgi:hypothetical protein